MRHRIGVSWVGNKAHKLAARLATVRDMDDLYWTLVSEWPDPAAVGLTNKDDAAVAAALDSV